MLKRERKIDMLFIIAGVCLHKSTMHIPYVDVCFFAAYSAEYDFIGEQCCASIDDAWNYIADHAIE
jgi:hypothetical protein